MICPRPSQYIITCHTQIMHRSPQHRKELALGELDQSEEQFLGDILKPRRKARTTTPRMTDSARERFIKNKAQFYAARTAEIVQDGIMHGQVRFLNHPLQLSQILLRPQQPQPLKPSLLDPQQHRQIIQKLRRQHYHIERRRRDRSTELELLRKEAELRDKELEEQKKDREVSERRERARLRLKQLSEIRMNREKSIKETNIQLSKVLNRTTLEDHYSEKYNRQVVLPALAEQHQRLEKIKKEKLSPINFEDIKKHEQQYINRKQQQSYSRLQSDQLQNWSYKAPGYVPTSYQLVEEEERKKELERIQKIEKKFQAAKNKEKLIKLLDQEFRERVRQNKLRRQAKKDLQKHRTIETAPLNPQQIKQRGNSYLQFSKQRTARKLPLPPSPQPQSTQNSTPVQRQRQKLQSLELSRFIRMRQHQRVRTMRVYNLTQDQKLSPYHRQQLLKQEAEKLDELVQRQDQLFQLREPTQIEIEDSAAIVLASVEAKIAILRLNDKKKVHLKTNSQKLSREE